MQRNDYAGWSARNPKNLFEVFTEEVRYGEEAVGVRAHDSGGNEEEETRAVDRPLPGDLSGSSPTEDEERQR